MTLLELMIASGVTTMALVMLMGSLASISSVSSISQERALSAAHLSSIMEEVGATNIDSLFTYEPPAFRGLRGEVVTVTCVDVDGEEIELPLETTLDPPALPNPVQIRARIVWQSASGHTHQRVVSTFHRL